MTVMFLIAVDIGNSSINIGVFPHDRFFVLRIDTHPVQTSETYQQIIRPFIQETGFEQTCTGAIISSVVPSLTMVMHKALGIFSSTEPMVVGSHMQTGLSYHIPDPEKLGSDRIANAVAAYEKYQAPVAVSDFGTATTLSIIGDQAGFLGGAIMPGIRLMNESLDKGTDLLPKVPLEAPETPLGTDTVQCIQSGLFYGTAGAVERILDETERERGIVLKFIITGGFAESISPFLQREHEHSPSLTFDGLRILYERNRNA
jgi:type III pantothenate kinase